jgi:hypothetical protein
MTSIIGRYETNPALFHSSKMFKVSTLNINEMMDIFYTSSRDLFFLYQNPLYVFINRLKIDLRVFQIMEPLPRIRNLEVRIDLRSYGYFTNVIGRLHYLEKLKIELDATDVDFKIFPDNLRELSIVGGGTFNIEHPKLEEIYIARCFTRTLLNIDKCPKLKSFITDLFQGDIICTSEHLFKTFTVKKLQNDRKDFYNDNVLIFDVKKDTWRPAFDHDDENLLYNSEESYHTIINDTWLFDRYTMRYSTKYFEARQGIDSIRFSTHNDILVAKNPNIKRVICNPHHVVQLIKFENLEHVLIRNDYGIPGNLKKLLDEHPNKNLVVEFSNSGTIIYDECFRNNKHRLIFPENPMFTKASPEFIEEMGFDRFTIFDDESFVVDGEKFNFVRFRDYLICSRKPLERIVIDCNRNFFSYKNPQKNCRKITFKNRSLGSDFDPSDFDEVILDNCFMVGKKFTCSKVFEMRGGNYSESMVIITLPKNLESLIIDNATRFTKIYIDCEEQVINPKKFLITNANVRFLKAIKCEIPIVLQNCRIE